MYFRKRYIAWTLHCCHSCFNSEGREFLHSTLSKTLSIVLCCLVFCAQWWHPRSSSVRAVGWLFLVGAGWRQPPRPRHSSGVGLGGHGVHCESHGVGEPSGLHQTEQVQPGGRRSHRDVSAAAAGADTDARKWVPRLSGALQDQMLAWFCWGSKNTSTAPERLTLFCSEQQRVGGKPYRRWRRGIRGRGASDSSQAWSYSSWQHVHLQGLQPVRLQKKKDCWSWAQLCLCLLHHFGLRWQKYSYYVRFGKSKSTFSTCLLE